MRFRGAVVIGLAMAGFALVAAVSAQEPPAAAQQPPAVIRILPSDTPAALAAKAVQVRPSARQVRWQSLEFQAFAHFGMDTFTDREWGLGTEDPETFNPTDFDAGQWVEALKAAGVRGLVVTAKHHDGFCLWPSRFTEHSVKNSPWRDGAGDVIREVSDACRNAGLAFGVYLSPWDRHEPSYGDSPRYNAFFKNQLRELLTQYGPVSEVWFDGACGEGPNGKKQVYDWAGYWSLVRELQPEAVISIMGPDARWIGNEAGVTRESEWSVIPVAAMDDAPSAVNPGGIASLDATLPDLGSRDRLAAVAATGGRLLWYPGQVDVSIRPGWFHHPAEDMKVRTVENLLDIYYTSVGGNAQLLLNVPPDRRGRLHENDVLALRRMGEALRRTFAENLAEAAKPSVEGGGRTLAYDLGGPRSFNVAMLREDIAGSGQRVERFVVETWDGRSWIEAARGTTIGCKRLLRFPTVAASRVRVRVTDARDVPSFAEFGLYLDPSRAAAHPAITPVPAETPGLAAFEKRLDGSWKFSPEPPREFWSNDVDTSSWADIQVPGEWATQGYTLGQDVERAYATTIDVPAEFAGRRLLLRFDGVYSYARVWVDGAFVRDHNGGFTSWQADVTGLLRPGSPSRLTVGVTDMSDEVSWGSSYAKHNIGGILKGVRLIALPAVHAARLHVEPALDAAYARGTLKVTAGVSFEGSDAREAEVRLSLRDPAGVPVPLAPDVVRVTRDAPEGTVACAVVDHRDGAVRPAAGTAGPVKTWDAEHPRLYALEARVTTGGTTTEVLRRDVGFRVVEVRGNKLLVNGRPVKLRGGDRHDVHPLLGRAVTPGIDQADAALFREANINYVRTSHYPPSEAFLDACDRAGLYVEEENAVCFVSTHGNLASSESPDFRAKYLGQFAEMIERDRDHPSVVMWSLGNESKFGDNVRRLYAHAKAEDPSRPVIWSYPDSVPKGEKAFDILSVHYPNFDADLSNAAMPRLNDEWAHVACYNVATLRRDPGVRDAWGESLARFWQNARAADGCLGGGIWGLIDDVFFLPGGAAGYGEWGIVDGWRRPKPEYWHVKKAYSPVRVEEMPLPNPGARKPLVVEVANWYDHTDLSELMVNWETSQRKGWLRAPAVPPGGTGRIALPAGAWKDGDVVRLRFQNATGLTVDEFAIPIGTAGPAVTKATSPKPAATPGGPAPTLRSDERTIVVEGAGFRVVFDRATGGIERAERDGAVVIEGGPFFACAPAALMPWSLTSIEARTQGAEAVVDVRGSFAGTLASYAVRVDGAGAITTDYEILTRPEGASEMGVSFTLPASAESLSWERRAPYGVYPDDHIGRPKGTAKKTRAGEPDVYRARPTWPWSEDMSEWFLNGQDAAGTGATRDFRSLKADIAAAAVGFGTDAPSLRVEPDGREAVRAEALADGRVRLHLLDAWSYADLAWGNYTGGMTIPAEFRGRVRLRLVSARSK